MRITAVLLLSREMEISMYPFSHGWPGTSFVGAWGFGRYTPEASAGRTRDSKKTPLRNGGREALAPALSPKIPAPYDSKRTGRAPRLGHLLAFTPVLHS